MPLMNEMNPRMDHSALFISGSHKIPLRFKPKLFLTSLSSFYNEIKELTVHSAWIVYNQRQVEYSLTICSSTGNSLSFVSHFGDMV